MNSNLSTFLNLSRWLAAFLVVISHVRHLILVDFKDVVDKTAIVKGLYLVTGLGDEAVVVFFVISGYLVGALTYERWQTNGPNLRAYAIVRFSRIYTVLLPALVVGLVLDLVGLKWFNASELYTNSAQYKTTSLAVVISSAIDIRHFLGNVFMLQGILTSSLGSNGPLWSLSFEWWYYFLFALVGAGFTGRKKFRLVYGLGAVATAFILPIKLVLYGNIWILGMVAYAWTKRAKHRPPPLLGIGVFLAALFISRINHNIDNLTNHESLMREFSRDFILASAFGLALVGASRIVGNLALPKLHADLAGFSFSTYLYHFPAMVFCVAFGYQVLGLKFQLQPGAVGIAYFVVLSMLLYLYCWGLSKLTENHTNFVRKLLS